MLKAIIFDLDGVIIDSEPLHFEADRRTMKEYGGELSESELISYVGMTGQDMWAELITKYNIPDTLDNIITRQLGHKRELLVETELEAIPGICELLERAKHAQLKIGLASSSPRYFIDAVIGNLGLTHYFAAVASGEEVSHSKPAPDVFLKAAELLDVKPEECLVIEDAGHGVRAAKAAGMRAVGFVNPNSGIQDLTQADQVVDAIGNINLSDYE